jgi:hypothetical protein
MKIAVVALFIVGLVCTAIMVLAWWSRHRIRFIF